MDDTLRTTGDVRVSEVLRDTLTGGSAPLSATEGVRAAGRGVTGVHILHPGGH